MGRLFRAEAKLEHGRPVLHVGGRCSDTVLGGPLRRAYLLASFRLFGCWITGGGCRTHPFRTITVPLPFVSVSVAPISSVTAVDPNGRLIVAVALRDWPAASGTEFMATAPVFGVSVKRTAVLRGRVGQREFRTGRRTV